MLKTSLLSLATVLALSTSALAQTSTRECDLLAASPYDTSLPSEISGIPFGQIDVAKAEDACRAAWETDANPRLAYQLGRTLLQAERYNEALPYFLTAAEEGHVEALNGAAEVLMGLARAESRLLRQQAADKGSVIALYNLGVIARDEDADAALAISYFEKAADLGDAEAAYNIAVLYDEGDLLPRDKDKAHAFYQRAVEGDYTWAKINLAHLLVEGTHSAEARNQAIALLVAATDEDGDINAGVDLALLLQSGDEASKAESTERMLTALKARDLQLARMLLDETSPLLPETRTALWAELSATSQDEANSNLAAYYASAQ